MKTSINHEQKEARQNGYTPERLSVKDAITWFLITVIALCMASSSQAGTPFRNNYYPYTALAAPVAQDITMQPIVQASAIWPFTATSASGSITMFTVQTLPLASEGILNIDINGELMPVNEGMMLSADLASNLSFVPNPSFTGDAIFTYTASDEEGLISNVAVYAIPVTAEPPVILPITLLHFTGTAQNKKAQLYWQTANEGNSSYFEIQRSDDGKNFEPVATVTAKGNITNNDYQTTDDLFFLNYNIIYYRIKMVDINGGFKYSSSVIIKAAGAVKSYIKAWPLPFSGNLNVAYNSEDGRPVKIVLRSINGGEIMSITGNAKKGTNTISIYQAQTIPAGTYLLTIGNGTKAETIKVIKQ